MQSEHIGKLTEAVSAIMGDFRGVEKTGVNAFHRYKYASDADLLWTLKPLMAKHGVAFTLDTVTVVSTSEVKTAKGAVERLVDVAATYRLSHKSGEWLTVQSLGSGQDPGDKAHYKAMTGAMKYALRQTFAVPTGDDPEKDDEDARPEPRREPARFVVPVEAAGFKMSDLLRFGEAKGWPDDWTNDRSTFEKYAAGAEKNAAKIREWLAANPIDREPGMEG